MANGDDNQDKVPGDLRRQLAVAVKSVQWSYAIFWSLSTTQEGTLEWGEGYYNGDIKTTKTVAAMELKAADKTGLQRSGQLRELYESLLESETDQQTKRPSAALNPDDLSDAEWFYLVCMSFVFNPGQGLPGKALANDEAIWLCNAHCADSKVFSRSLLAKSASIQTVLCFPHFGGVIELGVADLVSEDPNLIQHIKTCLLELSKPVCSENITSASQSEDGSDRICIKAEEEEEDSFLLEHGDWKNDLSNCIEGSICSMTREEESTDDLHYRRTLSVILKNSDKLLNNLILGDEKYKSSFMSWKRGETVEGHYKRNVQQKVLKTILLHIPYMHESVSVETKKDPKKRAENEKFLVLKSLVPSIREIDKASILDDTILYLKELEARVEELESCIDPSDCEAVTRTRRRQNYHKEMVEQTSDNIYNNGADNCKRRPWIVNKRKACNIDETDPSKKGSLSMEMKVNIKEENVLIEMKCVWREYLLIDIIDAIGSLNLEAYSVQSSNADGILTITLQSKVRGTAVASTRVIKQALSKVVGKC
ncbi:transcription factor EGL1-like [Impatiens glandulifera]|uniref:transcription factor EGL1-like n=1 Tax=Impatiens glandulifera TaxID=253017 RepID=UPI001FB0EDF5|nr:transcription factor EGL1-like [Impatiens glandulifera]XP_047341389.1 transcription factor EGL1-like [Impatiens glandulifera]